ncbi:bifunctional hydroxymethylpyrimidine kinase/phosphomethylpyrimidine kinase, partial [bacterium]|nr:bifunctional hydroxymethylpyrimidine kinase/phosphomethylpyrimidine kinase [bacterium]
MLNLKVTEENISYFIEGLKKFTNTKTLVVGDVMLDEYMWGSVDRISQEAPVPIVRVKKKIYRLGGATNVANNIKSFGGHVLTCGIIGNDFIGDQLLEVMSNKGLTTEGILRSNNRITTKKTRVIAQNQQVVRYDEENVEEIEKENLDRFMHIIEESVDKVDAVLIEDYGKGVITPELLSVLIPMAKKKNKIITIDPKVENVKFYKEVTCLTPNHHELAAALGIKIKDFSEIKAAGLRLLKELNSKSVLVTCGEKGMLLFEDNNISHIETVAEEIYDVTGAGDTVIAVLTMGL